MSQMEDDDGDEFLNDSGGFTEPAVKRRKKKRTDVERFLVSFLCFAFIRSVGPLNHSSDENMCYKPDPVVIR